MRKNRPKNYLKLRILLFGISILLTNCEKEVIHNLGTNDSPKLQISKISLNEFRYKERVFEKIDSLSGNIKNGNLQSRTVYDAKNDFYIDTDNITLIEVNDYHWLTFKITRDIEGEGLENLVLKYNVESETYSAYLVHYAFSEEDMVLLENSEYVSLVDKATFQPLESFDNSQLSDVLSRTIYESPLGYCYELVEETSRGTGDTILVEHEVPCPDGAGGTDNTDNPDDSNPYDDNNNDSDPDNDYNNGDGSQSGSGDGTNDGNEDGINLPDDLDDTVITLPITKNTIKECQKITNLFAANPTYKAKLQTLATNVTDNKEHSHSFHLDGTEHQEVGVVGSGGIDYPEYSSIYTAYGHIHDSYGENGEGTFSVYSFEDLIFVAKLAYLNELNSSKFITFLATNDGTKYAMTINDKNKLIDFFFNRIVDYIPSSTDFEAVLKYSQSKTLIDSLFRTYYDKDNPDAKIKVNSGNNELDLKMFMNFLKEAGDPGISLFESTDNFNSFKKITLNNDSSISKEECN